MDVYEMKMKKDAGSSDIGENSSSINRNKEIRKVEGMEKKSPYFSMLNLNSQNNFFHYPLSHSAFSHFL